MYFHSLTISEFTILISSIFKTADAVDSHQFLKSFKNLHDIRLEMVLGCVGHEMSREGSVEDLCNFLEQQTVAKLHLLVSVSICIT